MNPPSVDIKDILEQSSVAAGTFGTDLFISFMPEEPDACIAIFDTGGLEQQANYEYEYPMAQIRVRGERKDYVNAHSKAQVVRDALHGLSNESWNNARYIGMWCSSDIFFIKYDEHNRPIFTINFRIHRTST